jgi:tetratricopeptide (TPR) repeat protein
MKRAAIAWALVSAALLVPVLSRATDEPAGEAEEPKQVDLEQAKAKYEEAKGHYGEGKYEEALAAFTEAYNLSNKPDLLYNLGVCSEKLGQIKKAIAYYELYLEENPQATDREAVTKRLEALKASQEESAPEPAAATVEPAPEPSSAPDDELVIEEEEQTQIFWPGAVIGLGGLVLATGALTAIMAYNRYGDLEDSCSPDCSDSKVSKVKKAALAADIQFALGGAVVVAGVIWWITSDDGEAEVQVAGVGATPLVLPGGGGLMLEGEF